MKKVAIIGCGNIGYLFGKDRLRDYISNHIDSYLAISNVKVVAICDSNEKLLNSCKKDKDIQYAYTDYKQLLREQELDIISICTPPQTHLDIIKEIVKYNVKAIYCEKPISNDIDEAIEINKLCKQKGIILQINHQRRFCKYHKMVKEKYAANAMTANAKFSRGILNSGTHMFDLLRYFFGDCIDTFAYESSGALNVILKFERLNVNVEILKDVDYGIFDITLTTKDNIVHITNYGNNIMIYSNKPSEQYSNMKEMKLSKVIKPNKKDLIVYGIQHLISCIENNEESISSGEDALMALLIIKDIEERK